MHIKFSLRSVENHKNLHVEFVFMCASIIYRGGRAFSCSCSPSNRENNFPFLLFLVVRSSSNRFRSSRLTFLDSLRTCASMHSIFEKYDSLILRHLSTAFMSEKYLAFLASSLNQLKIILTLSHSCSSLVNMSSNSSRITI